MKSVIALAFAAGALAVPAWSDAPVKDATTTTASTTWADYPVKPTTTTTTSSYDPWKDDPLKGKTTTTTTTTTWADGTWSDAPVAPTTTTSAATTWADYKPTVTTTVTDVITTYCAKPTTWVHKGKTDSCTAGETKTVSGSGPYTVTIEVSYETSTVCNAKPSSTPVEAATGTWADVPVDATAVPSKPVAPVSPAEGKPPVAAYTGAASKMAGGALAGVAAIAALLL